MKEKVINAVIFVLLQVAFAVIALVNLFSPDSKAANFASPKAPIIFIFGIQIILLVMITARIIYSASVFWCLVIGMGITFLLAKATILRRKAI